MKTMTIRNIPDEVYDGLREMSRDNHRSLQEQVLQMLTQEVQLRSQSICEQAAEYRARISKRKFKKTVVDDIRTDRKR